MEDYTSNLSGNAYVSARLKGSTEWQLTKIRIVSRRNCAHVHTVCEGCATSWSWDWEIFWSRTGGGRRLKEL